MTPRSARLRLALFGLCVLGVPAALMATGRAQLVDLGRLAMILLPGPVGMLLRAKGPRGPTLWRWVAVAPLVTIAVVAGALGVAAAAGLVKAQGQLAGIGAPVSAGALSALTSVLEEWGWAGAGVALSVGALGRRWGIVVLGIVWAAWHLIPVVFAVGMFPDLEAGPPARLAAFVAACIVYRALLTRLQQKAGSWLAAAAAHAAPNALIAGLMAAGLGGFQEPSDWALYPAPGGLVFLVLAAVAAASLGRSSPRPLDAPSGSAPPPR